MIAFYIESREKVSKCEIALVLHSMNFETFVRLGFSLYRRIFCILMLCLNAQDFLRNKRISSNVLDTIFQFLWACEASIHSNVNFALGIIYI